MHGTTNRRIKQRDTVSSVCIGNAPWLFRHNTCIYKTCKYNSSSMIDLVKPQGCTNWKLRQLDRVVTRHYDAYVAATGLKNTQYALLSHVVSLGPIRPS